MKRHPLFFSSLVALGLVVACRPREVERAVRYVGLRASLAAPSLLRLAPLVGVVACEPNERSSDHPAEDLRFAVNVGTYSASGETAVSVSTSLAEGGVVELDENDELFLEDDIGAKLPASERVSVARLDAEQHPRVTFYRSDRLVRTMPLPLVRVIASRAVEGAAYDVRWVGAGVSDQPLYDSEALPLRAKIVVQVDDASAAGDAVSTTAIALFASDATTRVPMPKDCATCISTVSVVLEGSALSPDAGSWVTYSFNPSLVFEANADRVVPSGDAGGGASILEGSLDAG